MSNSWTLYRVYSTAIKSHLYTCT